MRSSSVWVRVWAQQRGSNSCNILRTTEMFRQSSEKVVRQVKSVPLYYYKKTLQMSSASDLKNTDNVATLWPQLYSGFGKPTDSREKTNRGRKILCQGQHLLYSFFFLTAAAASTCFRFIKLIINKKALTMYVEIHTTQVSCKI